MKTVSTLPPDQRPAALSPGEEAILHSGSPLLVLGGPGTGKTRMVEDRFLHLATQAGVEPHRILVLCSSRAYSVKARERLIRQLPHRATVEVSVYTWHALAYHLVTRYYPALGYADPPVLLTTPEQWGVVRALLQAEDSTRWPHWGSRLTERAFVDEVADFCLRVEQRGDNSQSLSELTRLKPEWAEVVAFVDTYREWMKSHSRMDYAQLISAAVRLLDTDPRVAAALHDRFPHVLVDDGQDMGPLHRELLRRLPTENLVVAADPDSGVETYRGADPDWVHGFEKEFGPHRAIALTAGRRVGSPLAEALNRMIGNNDESDHRPSAAAPDSTSFDCRQYQSTVEEVAAIARELRRHHVMEGVPWSQMAVLLSQPRQMLAPLQRALEQCEVPYQPLQGDRPLASEPVVRCFLDLVRVALGEAPARLLPELLTSPLVGLDYPTRRALEREAWRSRRTLEQVLQESEEAGEMMRLLEIVRVHRSQADECFWEVYSNAAYYRELEARALADPQDPANAAIDALVAFSHGLARFVERRRGTGSIDEYLNEATRADFGADPWLAPSASPMDGVAISTFHGAKGREWEVVVVAGCLDAWIPKGRRAQGLFDPYLLQVPDAVSREVTAISEDRRTFYVAASRARRSVLFTAAPANGGRSRPSRFLVELAGEVPEATAPDQLTPLTLSELSAGLRRTLAQRSAAEAAKAAAVVALSEIGGTDPAGWYGRNDWTAGSVPLVDGELRTSYSRLSVYENCGLQYVLQSVLGLDPASTYSMKFGTWIHALFEAWHRERIRTQQELREEYEKLFDPSIFPNATIARQFHRDGLKMLEVFWKHEAAAGPNVLAERSFDFSYAGARLRGRIDRIDRKNKNRAVILTDYKTAKWAPSYKEAQSSLQLAIYHLAAKTDEALKELGEPLMARLVYPGAVSRDGSHQVLVQTAEEAEKVVQKLPEVITSVVEEDFRPRPDADCFFCKMKLLCPLYPDGREVQ
ncbi:MAG TPA: ATP-dependent DNA helicase [Actinomycetota bacterium]|nr:ATP-dependent DNA helicase [Actinomycetota bacterium]